MAHRDADAQNRLAVGELNSTTVQSESLTRRATTPILASRDSNAHET